MFFCYQSSVAREVLPKDCRLDSFLELVTGRIDVPSTIASLAAGNAAYYHGSKNQSNCIEQSTLKRQAAMWIKKYRYSPVAPSKTFVGGKPETMGCCQVGFYSLWKSVQLEWWGYILNYCIWYEWRCSTGDAAIEVEEGRLPFFAFQDMFDFISFHVNHVRPEIKKRESLIRGNLPLMMMTSLLLHRQSWYKKKILYFIFTLFFVSYM